MKITFLTPLMAALFVGGSLALAACREDKPEPSAEVEAEGQAGEAAGGNIDGHGLTEAAAGDAAERPWRDWSGLSDDELKEKLTSEQYRVTQLDGTERPFENKYDGNKEAGLYVCIISGDPLFSSRHKFDSGTGWPSFYQPLDPATLAEVEDRSHGMIRVEVRAKRADSHLGHVFTDGPQPTGLRYCMNSAAMRFIPVDKLEEEGYGDFVGLFQD